MSIDAKPTPEGTETGTETRDLSNCVMIDKITPEMLLEDLSKGRGREAIRKRYAYRDEDGNLQELEKWMVDEMFKHPDLKGKKPSKVKVLPFTFGSEPTAEDTTPDVATDTPTSSIEEQEETDPQADVPEMANVPSGEERTENGPIDLG